MNSRILYSSIFLYVALTSCSENSSLNDEVYPIVAERQISSCMKYSAHRFAYCLDEAGKEVEATLIFEAMAARGDEESKEYLENFEEPLDFEAYIKRSQQSQGGNEN